MVVTKYEFEMEEEEEEDRQELRDRQMLGQVLSNLLQYARVEETRRRGFKTRRRRQ